MKLFGGAIQKRDSAGLPRSRKLMVFWAGACPDTLLGRDIMAAWGPNGDYRLHFHNGCVYAGAAGGYGHAPFWDTGHHDWLLVFDGDKEGDAERFTLSLDGEKVPLTFDVPIGQALSGFYLGTVTQVAPAPIIEHSVKED